MSETRISGSYAGEKPFLLNAALSAIFAGLGLVVILLWADQPQESILRVIDIFVAGLLIGLSAFSALIFLRPLN